MDTITVADHRQASRDRGMASRHQARGAVRFRRDFHQTHAACAERFQGGVMTKYGYGVIAQVAADPLIQRVARFKGGLDAIQQGGAGVHDGCSVLLNQGASSARKCVRQFLAGNGRPPPSAQSEPVSSVSSNS